MGCCPAPNIVELFWPLLLFIALGVGGFVFLMKALKGRGK
jgi:hypothetical protein